MNIHKIIFSDKSFFKINSYIEKKQNKPQTVPKLTILSELLLQLCHHTADLHVFSKLRHRDYLRKAVQAS